METANLPPTYPLFKKSIFFGVAWIVGVVSYIGIVSPNILSHTGLESDSQGNLFSRIFSVFSESCNLGTVGIDAVGMSIHTTRRIPKAGHVLVSVPAYSRLVVDGSDGSTLPIELTGVPGIDKLSHDSRTIIAIALSKRMDYSDTTSPLSLLWKAVGVHPIPDKRWIKYKGLFSLFDSSGAFSKSKDGAVMDNNTGWSSAANAGGFSDNNPSIATSSGLDELDEYLNSAWFAIAESFAFIKMYNLNRLYGISELDLKWSYVFLRSFGVWFEDRFIFVGPLVFARKSALATTVDCVYDQETNSIQLISRGAMEKGEEIIIDGSKYLSDVFAFAFHGSWVSQDSVHRGWVRLSTGGGAASELPYLLSSQMAEQLLARKTVINYFSTLSNVAEDQMQPIEFIRACKRIVAAMKARLGAITTSRVFHDSNPVDKLSLIYANLLIREIIHFEKKIVDSKVALVEVYRQNVIGYKY